MAGRLSSSAACLLRRRRIGGGGTRPRIRLPSPSPVRKECTVSTVFPRWKAASRRTLSLSLFLFSVSYRLVEDTFFHDAFIYVYIYSLASIGIHGIEEKGQVYLGEKKCLPGKTSIRVTSLMVSRIFQMSRFYRWIGNFILDSRRSARTNDC